MNVPEGDAERGRKLFVQRCSHCHTVEDGGKQSRAPSLYGIIGRRSGSAPGYENYSEANKSINIVWTKRHLFQYLEHPRKFIPGTKRVKIFTSVKKEADRADLIAYLDEQN